MRVSHAIYKYLIFNIYETNSICDTIIMNNAIFNISEKRVAWQTKPVMVCKYEENLGIKNFITIIRAGKFKSNLLFSIP